MPEGVKDKIKKLPKIGERYISLAAILSLTSLGFYWGYLGILGGRSRLAIALLVGGIGGYKVWKEGNITKQELQG